MFSQVSGISTDIYQQKRCILLRLVLSPNVKNNYLMV